jgi:hypothetical protein
VELRVQSDEDYFSYFIPVRVIPTFAVSIRTNFHFGTKAHLPHRAFGDFISMQGINALHSSCVGAEW